MSDPQAAPAGTASGSAGRLLGRVVLGLFMGTAGVGHFVATDSFSAQVPPWMPFHDAVIYLSGVIELGFAAGLLLAPARWRPTVGWLLAGFYVAVFPGNISQFVTGTSAFGLDTDAARLARLFFQPVLVAWALWCTGAWARYRRTTP